MSTNQYMHVQNSLQRAQNDGPLIMNDKNVSNNDKMLQLATRLDVVTQAIDSYIDSLGATQQERKSTALLIDDRR
jgi:hypothetical protein